MKFEVRPLILALGSLIALAEAGRGRGRSSRPPARPASGMATTISIGKCGRMSGPSGACNVTNRGAMPRTAG